MLLVRLLFVIAGLLLSAESARVGASSDQPITVMTYNIHHGETARGVLDLQGIARIIARHDADVVGLQEVDRHWSDRSQFADQVRKLARQLNMNYFFAPIYDRPPPEEGKPRRQYGLAILSRFPIVEEKNFEISRLPSIGDHPRTQRMGGFPMVTLKVGDRRLHIFNTHLDYRGDPAVRRMQVKDMLDVIAGVEGTKVLLGDLNARPGADELSPLWKTFVDAWNVRGREAGHTYPSDDPVKRIDYVLVTPDIGVDTAAVVKTRASDHRPVVVDITLPTASRTNDSSARQGAVKTGARVLTENDFARLQGKRVGLVANHTARVDTAHLIDLMHRAGIEIGALFGPEHGLRGSEDAGEAVSDGRHETTDAPIYSLYDETRAPTQAELEGLDALVFDVQDVGARFFTYITTMGLAMQSAAEAGLPFVVLDRPNPLGGSYVSGFIREPEHASFVGKYPIPIAHGLTVGELARLIKGEDWLPGLDDLGLEIVEMEEWERTLRWPETGLPWIRPSPNLPTFETAIVYAGTCLFEATTKASEGRGTRRPFTHLGAPWADGRALADTLNVRDLSGVRFYPFTFTPEPNAGDAAPKFEGKKLQGVRIEVTDTAAYAPVEMGIHVLHAFYRQARRKGRAEGFFTSYLELLAGTDRLRNMLRSGARPGAIVAAWQREVQAFRERRRPYLLYP